MTLNLPLKFAVIESGKSQEEVAALAKIHSTRLSQIIRGRALPNESERLRLAGVLQKPVADLFPSSEAVA